MIDTWGAVLGLLRMAKDDKSLRPCIDWEIMREEVERMLDHFEGEGDK